MKNVNDEVHRILDIYNSTEILDEAGYLEMIKDIMSNPAVVYHIMRKYDMSWDTDDTEYKSDIEVWRKLFAQAENTPGIKTKVLDAFMTHIMDMTESRPVKPFNVDKIEKFDKSGYTVTKKSPAVYADEYDEESSYAAEPMTNYGNLQRDDEKWVSVRRGTRKPNVGQAYLVAGWYYAGVVETLIAVWKGKGIWDYKCPDDYRKPDFTPLLWRDLPLVPDYIMDEAPEVNQ